MKHLRFLTIIVILLSFSCQKKVSNEHDFVGLWIEKDKIGGCTIEFTKNGLASINLYSNNNVQDYNYRFDEDFNEISFSMPDKPESEWSFRYSYDEKSKELTIWGLYISIPENPSKTVLTKVTL